MDKILTIDHFKDVYTWNSNGVRVAICENDSIHPTVVKSDDYPNFQMAAKHFMLEGTADKYKVFRIDSLNDKICLYVTEI